MSSPSHFSLLVVDDEPDLRTLYELTLLREGYDVETAGTVDDALLHLKDRTYSAVITDMRLPDGTGLDLLRRLEEGNRREKAIVITAYGSAENAVEALKAGAYDYLTKPVDLKQFRAVVASALGRSAATVPTMVPSSLPSENGGAATSSGPSAARPVAPAPAAPPVPAGPVSQALMRMAGQSQAMQQVRQLIDKVARSMAPVLVNGESGTGKELVARAIHEISPRGAQPFVPVNCSAIPEQLLEAEFFGYRKGAFTGAAEDREGFFQAANGGTLFLDEIGDLPLAMQSKLLRAIQERSVRPVGAVVEQAVNVRLLSATHKDLGAEVQAGKFRQDLYYRLNVIQIRVPPLRERLEDLPSICDRVLDRIARDAGVSPAPRLTRDAMVQLSRYSFPGNVRELENLLHRAVALTVGDVIDVADLGVSELVFSDSEASEFDATPVVSAKPVAAAAVAEAARAPAAPVQAPLPSDLAAYLDDIERDVLERALERYRYNRTAAGASLGLSLRQMRYRMARLGVNVGGTDDPVDVERGEPG
ncbi:sigma-54 dependent transcriptional regulator [Rhizobacter sp. SG703]|uniref:sigma-54-dependent transcriptional regulator n=1 Tax=Rhizobacter sp. SG703 TaxID=2587140 RepID=UPI00144518F0|nr:sigma-54 dependent transcriptional regulator [Rhizobacter sp. SG703]NKI94121.1 two-component system response regulator PilR (NtrC family) [Rhizobacter sp. SG703]